MDVNDRLNRLEDALLLLVVLFEGASSGPLGMGRTGPYGPPATALEAIRDSIRSEHTS